MMSVPSLLEEPGRVDEPQAVQEYSALLTRVVAAGRPLIVRRNGEDLAAVIPLEHLELLRELQREHLAHQDVERLAAAVDWTRSRALRPPQSWFDDEGDNPFEPEEEAAP
jgi:PHD/YefM family antitoxin component YafN of YafNO toxin-antitoxin module